MAGRLAVTFLLAATFAGSALAGAKDPQKRINAADQAWARSIRVQRSDLPGVGWKASKSDDSDYEPSGCKTPSLSDLVATGDADDMNFGRGGSLVSSGATVFASERQATTAWARVTRVPWTRCFAAAMREGAQGSGLSISLQKGQFVRLGLAPHELGYRLRFTMSAPGGRVAGRIGFYAFARGRAFGGVVVMSLGKPLQPVPLALEQKLAATVASRLRR